MKERIKRIIARDDFLNTLKTGLSGVEAYLAGGYIRDIAVLNLEEPPCDRDIVIFNADTEAVAKKIADSTGSAFVVLDEKNRIFRIVAGENYADIAEGLNNSVSDDIDRRDFTINSIFYSLNDEVFYDKNNGFCDIKDGIIRTKTVKNLFDDPLRALRAYRFKAQLGFRIEEDITDFIKNTPKCLEGVAKERINQEIMKMFAGKFLPETLPEMLDIGLLEEVFPFIKNIKKIPPNSHHHLDLVHHSIETVKQIRSQKPLLRLAALCHDIAKPLCWTIEPETGRHRFIGHDEKGGELVREELSRLKFSKKQIDYVSKMVKNHIYPSSLMSSDATTKAMARFVRKIYPDAEDLIELARADRLSARGMAVTDEMVARNLQNLDTLLNYYNSVKEGLKEIPKLLDGREIMALLDIKADKRLGEIINELKEAQIAGTVKTKEDAVKFVKSL